MAVEHGGYLTNPEAEAAKVEAVIEAATKLGLYVIVDWHAHQPHPKEAADYFGKLAAKYGDRPNLIYETYNEPLQHHGWAEVVRPYHMQVAAAIRAVDPDNLIVAGTNWTGMSNDDIPNALLALNDLNKGWGFGERIFQGTALI